MSERRDTHARVRTSDLGRTCERTSQGVEARGQRTKAGRAVLVVVVAYRSAETICDCLRSVINHRPDSLIVVVDNSDDDATHVAVELVSAETGVGIYLDNPRANLGYARAVNRAERGAMGTDLILVLNPDVVLTADPLGLVPMLEHADVVAGTLIEKPLDLPRRFPNARPRVSLTRELLRSWFGSRAYRGPRRYSGVETRVDQLDGAFLLTRRAWLREHPLDETFDLYFEDVSLCDAARVERGCAISPNVVGIHAGGASAKKSEGLAYTAFRVSRARYLRRRYPKIPWLLLGALFVVEVVSRTWMRRPESCTLRLTALGLAVRELKHPGSVRVLSASL